MSFSSGPKRRWLVPEVVQTSEMDCGPAALKCLLEGFGLPANYGRLREACCTDVDGTSIDTVEDVAVQLGLDAEQVILPPDHLLLSRADALPAVAIVKMPDGTPHFVTVWRTHGPLVQVMDPAIGRRWLLKQRFLNDLWIHHYEVAPEDWLEYAKGQGFLGPLRQRLANLAHGWPDVEQLMDKALAAPGWRSIAALDAAVRLTSSLVTARGLKKGREAGLVLARFFKDAEDPKGETAIPRVYWSAVQSPGGESLVFSGAVIVRAAGLRSPDLAESAEANAAKMVAPLSPEMAAAIATPDPRPEKEILKTLMADGLLGPILAAVALASAAAGATIHTLILGGLLNANAISQQMGLPAWGAGAAAAFFAFFLLLALLETPLMSLAARMGRRLETRLRMAFLQKIPRLPDEYLHSRLISDMVQRVHNLRTLRTLPLLAFTGLRLFFGLLFTAAGVIWLNPSAWGTVSITVAAAVGLSLATQPLLREQDLRIRTIQGALTRYYLDGLLGMTPIRSHSGQDAIRSQHEHLLVKGIHAQTVFYRTDLFAVLAEAVLGACLAIWILQEYLSGQPSATGALLTIYWSLRLPMLGGDLARTAQQYPMHRNRVRRILEPLGAMEEAEDPADVQTQDPASPQKTRGAALRLSRVRVRAAGNDILKDATLTIASGERVAVVGTSGAGKSSLAGLFMGWRRPADGQVLVDGTPLVGNNLRQLRAAIAWVDPALALWNRPMLDNLVFGASPGCGETDIRSAIEMAELTETIHQMPQGLRTRLGESGRLVSGGEGQRVRLARAALRQNARLVIMDEPFRGLDRTRRRALLQKSLNYWQDATIIFISHDVADTILLPRVLVMANGRIVEDGAPKDLSQQPHSLYRSMLKDEEAVRAQFGQDKGWRHLWIENSRLSTKEKNKPCSDFPKI